MATLAFLALFTNPAGAQEYRATVQLTISDAASGVSFTGSDLAAGNGHPQILSASCVSNSDSGEFRYRVDGTAPTASVGVPVPAGGAITFDSPLALLAFKAIKTGATNAVLNCALSSNPSPSVFPVGASGGSSGSISYGTAGLPHANTVSVQGVVSGQPVPVSGTVTADRGTGWGTDPCASTPTTVAIDTATSGNVELVAISGSTVVYVCGYNFIADGTVAVQMIVGTGTACATNEANKTGAYSLVANGGINVGFAGSTVYKGAAGDAACIELSGAVGVRGILSYVQQ